MPTEARFKAAHPFQADVLAVPVTGLEQAARWYATHFGMTEIERREQPDPALIMGRDDARIGFAINGGDPAQDGAAILVSNIRAVRADLESRGVQIANWRIDERDGQRLQVFFVIAPDGLCFSFHEPVGDP